MEAIEYIFVIDTNKYSGNFERQMCAYCTGFYGECEVGKEYAKMFDKDFNIEDEYEGDNIFYENIEYKSDDGCSRPCIVFNNPKYGNDGDGNHVLLTETNKDDYLYSAYNSVGILFFEKPTEKQIEIMKERALKFVDIFDKTVKIEGFRLMKEIRTIEECFSFVL